MEPNHVDVEAIMASLRKKAAQREYEKEALDFKSGICVNDVVRPFKLEDFKEGLTELSTQYYVEFDHPIGGKFRRVKKLIKKFYRFHMKPLWDRQNDINIEMVALLNQVKDYMEQTEQRCIQQEQQLKQQEQRIKQLEQQDSKGALQK